jgi:hypothetical protein
MARLKRVVNNFTPEPAGVPVPNRVKWDAWIDAPRGAKHTDVFARAEAEWRRTNG